MIAPRLSSKHQTIKIGNQSVVLSDCLQTLAAMPEKAVDLFVTSPPYNISIKYASYQDNKPDTEYLDWLHEVFSKIKRVLREDGSVFLNIGCTNRNPWLAYEIMSCFKDLFILQNRIVWVKSISIGDTTSGHFKPINSDRYINNNFEEVFHLTKYGDVKLQRKAIGVPYMDKNNIKRKSDADDLRCRGNCWFIPYETIRSKDQKGRHPAIFPERLPEWCIKIAGYNPDTIICDPFLGTGTTLIAAQRLGINGIGIEMDQEYAEYAVRRLCDQR